MPSPCLPGVPNGPPLADFGLLPTFSTWSQVTMLHMYLIYARVRNLEAEVARNWQAQLADHFFWDAETRMDVLHGITSHSLRQKHLWELYKQWQGIIAAYDEGVYRGDAVLASAVWRNVFKGREDVDLPSIAAIVSWMRLCLRLLDQMPDEVLYTEAQKIFQRRPKNELRLVDQPARQLEDDLDSAGSSDSGPSSRSSPAA